MIRRLGLALLLAACGKTTAQTQAAPDAAAPATMASAAPEAATANTGDARPPDRHDVAAAASDEQCETAVSAFVYAFPPVKKLIADLDKALEKPGHADDHRGGVGPMTSNGEVSGMFGVHHPDRFESDGQFDYSFGGVLTITVMGDAYTSDPAAASDKAHLIPAASLAKLQAACGH